MAPLRGRAAEALVVVAGYLAVAVVATWPLARHPLGGLYGFGNDNLGGVWILGWLHDAYLGAGSPGTSPELQAPFGYALPDQAIQPMDRLFALAFGGLGQGLGAYNAQIFLSFVLAGCAMYLLARHLTGSRLAAGVAGLVYTYSPFHLAIAMQYNALASIQWLPLYLLALLVLLRRGRKRDAALAGGAFALVAVTSYYYAWFAIWTTIALVLAFVVRAAWLRRRAGRPERGDVGRLAGLLASRGAIGIAVALAIVIPSVLPSLEAAADDEVAATTDHPISEAVRYSGRPWMLVTPPHDNPLTPESVQADTFRRLYDSPVYEQAIYLGLVALLLAIVACLRPGRRLGGPSERARAARPYLLVGAATGLLIVMGPYVPLEAGYWQGWADPGGSRHLPSLGRLMFEISPNFRFFVRAFVIVSVCLAALTALGFVRLERAVGPSPLRRGALFLAVVGLIGLEYSHFPPRVWLSDAAPPWVATVRDLPGDGGMVDYPIASTASPRSLYYLFWQSRHGRPTVNPADTRRAQAFAQSIAAPDDPRAGRALSEAGIAYAVVHTALPPSTTPPYQPALPDDSLPAETGSANPWLDRLETTADVVVYRVRRAPRPVVARAGEGFGPAEAEGGRRARWLEARSGVVAVRVSGRPRRVGLRLELASLGRTRAVAAALDGRPLTRAEIGQGYETLALALGRLPRGDHVLRLTATPGPAGIGGGDPRSVSLRLGSLAVEVGP